MIFPNIFSFFYFFKGIKYLQWALSDVKIERVSRLLSWKPCQGTFLYFRKSFWLKGLDGGFQFHQKQCCLDIAGAISRETGSWRQLCPQGPSPGQGAATIRLASWGHGCSSSARRWARPGQLITREVMTGEQSLVPIFQKYIFSLFTLCN